MAAKRMGVRKVSRINDFFITLVLYSRFMIKPIFDMMIEIKSP